MKIVEKLNLVLGFIIIILIATFNIYFIFFKKNTIKENTLSETNNDLDTSTSTFTFGKNASVENVSLSIKKGTLTENGATLIIEDKNKNPFCYTNDYSIEMKEGKNWILIGEYHDVNEMVWFKNDGIYEIKADWSKVCGKLRKGKYRISKNDNNGGTIIQLYSEFKIK